MAGHVITAVDAGHVAKFVDTDKDKVFGTPHTCRSEEHVTVEERRWPCPAIRQARTRDAARAKRDRGRS